MTQSNASHLLSQRAAIRGILVRIRRAVTAGIDGFEERPVLSALLLGTLTAVAAACVGLLTGIPQPSIHDEFSYLLQADTFASGRLTNPTPSMWEHFETFHVIMRPSYASKYPPGQGLVLGLGQWLGHPIIGVWLSVGLMVAAITWMLCAWLPHRWAVTTGFIAAIQIGIASYWAQSYWGGAVATAGGALVFGALLRVARKPSLAHGLALGCGFSILALSRPFEGFLVSLPAVGVIAYLWVVRSGDQTAELGHSAVAAAIPTVLTLAFIGYYNWQVTGDPARFPYRAHEEQYAATPTFLWQDLPAFPEYRHAEIKEYWRTHGVARFERYQEPRSFLRLSAMKTAKIFVFFLGPGILLLAFLIGASQERWILFASLVTGGLMLVSLTTMGSYAHYFAPAAALLYAVLGACLARLYQTAPTVHGGARRVAIIMLAFCAFSLFGFDPYGRNLRFADRRAELHDRLSKHPGSDVVIVRYGPDHNVHQEWVYNRARLDSAEVIWARDMGRLENDSLVSAYPNRRAWMLEVGSGKIQLSRYGHSSNQRDGT